MFSKKWTGDNEPLTGFPWNLKEKCDANDIIMWNDIFKITHSNGKEKIAIVVIDTQEDYNFEQKQDPQIEMIEFLISVSSICIINSQENSAGDYLEVFKKALDKVKRNSTDLIPQQFNFILRDVVNI